MATVSLFFICLPKEWHPEALGNWAYVRIHRWCFQGHDSLSFINSTSLSLFPTILFLSQVYTSHSLTLSVLKKLTVNLFGHWLITLENCCWCSLKEAAGFFISWWQIGSRKFNLIQINEVAKNPFVEVLTFSPNVNSGVSVSWTDAINLQFVAWQRLISLILVYISLSQQIALTHSISFFPPSPTFCLLSSCQNEW